jgi:hypothetical protein
VTFTTSKVAEGEAAVEAPEVGVAADEEHPTTLPATIEAPAIRMISDLRVIDPVSSITSWSSASA